MVKQKQCQREELIVVSRDLCVGYGGEEVSEPKVNEKLGRGMTPEIRKSVKEANERVERRMLCFEREETVRREAVEFGRINGFPAKKGR